MKAFFPKFHFAQPLHLKFKFDVKVQFLPGSIKISKYESLF